MFWIDALWKQSYVVRVMYHLQVIERYRLWTSYTGDLMAVAISTISIESGVEIVMESRQSDDKKGPILKL